MRRRAVAPAVEPPARLRTFDPAEWPAVDWESPCKGYAGSDELWVLLLRYTAWTRARLAYAAERGWPYDAIDMIREHVATKRKLVAAHHGSAW